jgi:hypothetical protein
MQHASKRGYDEPAARDAGGEAPLDEFDHILAMDSGTCVS